MATLTAATDLVDAVPGPTSRAEPDRAATGFVDRLYRSGVSRRAFLGFCAEVTAVLALPPSYTHRVVRALDRAERPTLVWLAFQDCAGDTESFLRVRNPSVAELVLDLVSLDYHETLMAAAGTQAEQAKRDALRRGGHLVVVEGSIPLADGGVSCVIGGRTARDHLLEAVHGAAAVINVGTCSAYGGIPAARPNPTGAVGVEEVLAEADAAAAEVPVLNLPGCPVNADNLTATLVHYLTFGELPPADQLGRPLFAYGSTIHENCPRRGHYDAGQFAQEWGDEGHRQGWCLYRLGCKGPSTFHNCTVQRWNGAVSSPIAAGHGCVGCSEPGFWDTMTPFYDRLPHVRGADYDVTAERLGLAVVAATATGFAAHGVGKAVQRRRARTATDSAGDEPRPAEPAPTASAPAEPAAGATRSVGAPSSAPGPDRTDTP